MTTAPPVGPALRAPLYAVTSGRDLVQLDASDGAVVKVIARIPGTARPTILLRHGVVTVVTEDSTDCRIYGPDIDVATGEVVAPEGRDTDIVMNPDSSASAIVTTPMLAPEFCDSDTLEIVDRSGKRLALFASAPKSRESRFYPATFSTPVWFGNGRSFMVTHVLPGKVLRRAEDGPPPEAYETRIVDLDHLGRFDQSVVVSARVAGRPYEMVFPIRTLESGDILASVSCCVDETRRPPQEDPPSDIVTVNRNGQRTVVARGPVFPESAGAVVFDPTGVYFAWMNIPRRGDSGPIHLSRLDGSDRRELGGDYLSLAW